ncbi:MAG: hypothetical protein IPK69_08940 [Phycisphaerales bacterium]|nr:MAG: hypothetical protein IPK69_08940 [Phycisphaerales bacterium]
MRSRTTGLALALALAAGGYLPTTALAQDAKEAIREAQKGGKDDKGTGKEEPGKTLDPREQRGADRRANRMGNEGRPSMAGALPGTQNGTQRPAANSNAAPGAANAMQPAGATPAVHQDIPDVGTGDDETITLAAFSEPVQLTTLVELLVQTLDINVVIKGDLMGAVTFYAPVSVHKSELMSLVNALLEQYNFTITSSMPGFYTVHPRDAIESQLGMADAALSGATTRVIPTPNVRASSISTQVTSIAPTKSAVAFDDLGLIVATGSPRQLDSFESLVNKILSEFAKAEFTRIEVRQLSAPVALQRVLALVGQTSPTRSASVPSPDGQPPQQNAAPTARPSALDNLADRLTVDPQGNALIFRGVQSEIDFVQGVVAVIDRTSELEPKRYEVGSAAKQIADIARERGMGEVVSIEKQSGGNNFGNYYDYNQQYFSAQARQQRLNQPLIGGPVMVIDESSGSMLYYGTAEQHTQMDKLIAELDIKGDFIVIRNYKLKHSDAEEAATLIQTLLGQATGARNSLLPGGGGTGVAQPVIQNFNPDGTPAGELALTGENASVTADTANNQILVRAPAKQQDDFEKLIQKIDLRRPQVYIEAKIVSVNWTDDMRLAFESQLINAGGSGGALNTNFGLSTFPNTFTDPKAVATGLPALTAAVIRNDQIPIILTALQRKVDTRILSTPQLLVDDNEEAKIASVDEQPTTTTTQTSGNPTTTSFGGYEQAGTDLTVTPHISEGGYMRLEYTAKLSSFTGPAAANTPPPRQTNELNAVVTVPSDMTVVVGGLTFSNKGKTKISVPLLGEIPLIGRLFSDDNTNDRKTTLYVFLTPKIMRDEHFRDLRLLTEGPMGTSQLNADTPALTPSTINLNQSTP